MKVFIVIIALALIVFGGLIIKLGTKRFPKPLVDFVQKAGKSIIGWIFVWVASMFVASWIHPRFGTIYSYYLLGFVLITIAYFFFEKRGLDAGKKIATVVAVALGIVVVIQTFGWVKSPALDEIETTATAKPNPWADNPSDAPVTQVRKTEKGFGAPLGTPIELSPDTEVPVTLPSEAIITYSTSQDVRIRNLANTIAFTVGADGKNKDVVGANEQSGLVQTTPGVWMVRNISKETATVVITSE